MCYELGQLAKGYKNRKDVTNTVFFMTHNKINNIPSDRTVTYAWIVVDCRPQKDDPNRVCITAGDNIVQYPGEVTTLTADFITAKLHWNRVISAPGSNYMCLNCSNFYLKTPMERYEYMKIQRDLVPDEFMNEYNLYKKVKIGICTWKS